MHIRKAVLHAIVKFGGNAHFNNIFMTRKHKGSAVFRKILGEPRNGEKYKGMNIIRTFFNLVELVIPEDKRIACSYLGIWNYSIWPTKISTFLYQLYHNSLPVAARTGNRYRNIPEVMIDERCFWCLQNNFNVPGRETFSHIYFDCPISSAIFSAFCTKYTDPALSALERREYVFLGMNRDKTVDPVIQIVGLLLMYCIWEGKIRRKKS